MQFSSAEKVLYVKLVYYGPGLSGKTTNLEMIHKLTDPRRRQAMVSLKTEADRTLFFDLLPFDLGQIHGLDVRIKLYTVPGQIQYDTTRKQVLAGADGVVFVADSSPKQREQNQLMIRYLKNNLDANGLDARTIPFVMQWNKRDLVDAMDVETMDQELNWRHVPAVPAIANSGPGVMETFREITVATLEGLARRAPGMLDRTCGPLREKVESFFAGFIEVARRQTSAARPDPIGPVYATGAKAGSETQNESAHVGLDELLSHAVETNMAFGERLVADTSREQLLHRIRRERRATLDLCRLAAAATDETTLARVVLRAALAGLDITTGSLLRAAGPRQPLREVTIAGRRADPLNSVVSPGIGSVATTLCERNGPVLCHDPLGEFLFGQPHPAIEGLRSVLAVPIKVSAGNEHLLVLYADASTRDFDADDVEYASIVAALAALAMRGVPVAG